LPIYITHRRQQWPVGHGFFHTASLKADAGGRTYRYVYDCGSVARTLVEERIGNYSENEYLELRGPELDMLVLSHFHVDHCNGVPHLLTLFTVKKLVLPFLSNDFKLAALADLAASGLGVWNDFSGLVLDPETWMRDRGQGDTRITLIRPNGPEGQDVRRGGVQDEGILLPAGDVNHDITGTIGAAGDEFWDFRFYAHENWNRYFSLVCALVEKFSPQNEADLLTWLSDPVWIAANHFAVTEVFRSLGSPNQNGITLCMYSSPRHGRHAYGFLRRTNHGPVSQYNWYDHECTWRTRVGWLGTGDAELRDPPLYKAFATHYRDYSDAVDTLTIPHHGSIENYCSALGEMGQSALLTSDHVNDPHDHHPSHRVMVNIRTKCKPIFIVTRDIDSAVFSTAKIFVD
jgi:Metallo-beta-lactamase superfamily